MPSVEGTPMLSIAVGDEDRSGLDLDLDVNLREVGQSDAGNGAASWAR